MSSERKNRYTPPSRSERGRRFQWGGGSGDGGGREDDPGGSGWDLVRGLLGEDEKLLGLGSSVAALLTNDELEFQDLVVLSSNKKRKIGTPKEAADFIAGRFVALVSAGEATRGLKGGLVGQSEMIVDIFGGKVLPGREGFGEVWYQQACLILDSDPTDPELVERHLAAVDSLTGKFTKYFDQAEEAEGSRLALWNTNGELELGFPRGKKIGVNTEEFWHFMRNGVNPVSGEEVVNTLVWKLVEGRMSKVRFNTVTQLSRLMDLSEG